MGERIPPGVFHLPPPRPIHPPPHCFVFMPFEPQRLHAELLAERQRLVPFERILPHFCRLVNQEINRLCGYNEGFQGHERYEGFAQRPSGRPMNNEASSSMQIQEEKLKDKPGYEHLSQELHVLVEAAFPEDEIDARLDKAIEILEIVVMKPVV